MKRREMIKGLAALGVMMLMPDIKVSGNPDGTRLHFIGLGQAGTNAMVNIHKKGIDAKYSCIASSYVSHLTRDIDYLFFESMQDFRVNGIRYRERLPLTNQMKNLFKENDSYIILTGLGSSVGTGLISNLLKYLQSEKKSYLAICSLPVKAEGRSVNEYASLKMRELASNENVLFFDHNQFIEETVRMSVPEVFRQGNEQFYTIFKNNYPHIIERQQLN
ncbi:MAG: hypothetical protein GZ094_00240 [Mariniphaga sp.]|nr:hypothetical protein [Mariniphaga sp.]